jgi:hypothetical protein
MLMKKPVPTASSEDDLCQRAYSNCGELRDACVCTGFRGAAIPLLKDEPHDPVVRIPVGEPQPDSWVVRLVAVGAVDQPVRDSHCGHGGRNCAKRVGREHKELRDKYEEREKKEKRGMTWAQEGWARPLFCIQVSKYPLSRCRRARRGLTQQAPSFAIACANVNVYQYLTFTTVK